MKILMINKFFYIKGGSETYYFSLKKLLEDNGHTVIDFSMMDNRNYETPFSKFFVKNVDFNASSGIISKVRIAKNIIYSTEAKKNLKRLIKETKPDIAHLHIFQHQLSPSILDVLEEFKIPTIYTAHDLKMLCLNYMMMTNGQICEKCKKGRYINCFKQKCVKNSKTKSLINVVEGYVHKWRHSYDVIDKIITPSDFYRNKFIQFGISPNRVTHIPNFTNSNYLIVNQLPEKEKYFLYFGRLSHEKGIMTLIKAMYGMKQHLYVVGTGPIEDEIMKFIQGNEITNIKVLGFKAGQELTDIVGNSIAVILPSEWYENGPYSAIEALQYGKPLIGSDIGGIPELINGNGYIFKHGDVEELKNTINKFPDVNSDMYRQFCHRSLEIFNSIYNKDRHYQDLMQQYQLILSEK
jgi:glycosyltransferase involved in cell wall biosynthesis